MQMFQHIKPKSPQAHYFHTKYFLPVVMQAFFQKLNTTSVSVLLCAPGSNSLLHDTLEDIKATWDSHDQMTLSYTPEDFKVDDSLLQRLIKTSKKVDVIFGMLSNTDTAIALFSQYKESLPLSKLFLIVDEAILEDLEKHPALLALVNSEHLITRKLVFSTAIDNGQFYTLINHYIAAFRATKFQYSERTHRHLPALYQCYRVQVKALMNPDCLFLMGFLKYLEADKKPVSLGFLRTHLELEHSDTLACRKRLLVTNFLKLKDEQISLTQFACEFLECISLDNIPRLSDVHQRFHARWKRHIEQTITTHFALREDVQSLHALGKIMYQAYAASGFLIRVRQWLSTKWYGSWLIDNDWLPAEQQAYWEHTLVKKHLFPIWQEYIGEWSKVGFPEQRDRARFLQTILDAYQVLRKKKNADISKRFDNLVFSLSMLRPNNVAHIYIGYSFKQRRQPDLIKDYFQMAVITGKYELLLNRYPPYHVMLNLHATPGTRTLFDSRGIDFTPMTIPLNFEYHCAVDLPKTQTRQQGRYLEIPSYIDKEKEALHQADIKKRKTDLANIFPAPDYISNIQFDLEHARILYTGEEKPIEIERYGQNRSKYIQDKSAFNLLSSLPPVPGNESGLVVRFKLREPLSALLDGLSMKRPFTLDEVCDVLKILDLYKAKRHQSDDKQACLDDIIRLVMTQAEIKNLSESTNEFLDEVNRIRQVDPTETSAWQYIIHQAADGKCPELLPALCNKLTNEGFDLVFSLMPALIGQELEVTPENLAQALEELEKTQNEEKQNKKTTSRLFITDILKSRLQELLHQVFSRYVDISAATRRQRSEALLAQMIVEECLKFRNDFGTFKTRLYEHLKNHHKVNKEFLTSTYIDKNAPSSVVHTSLRLSSKADWEHTLEDEINNDMNGIIEIIQNTRKKLFSRGQSNRILCFIDQASIDVSVGEFIYSGEEIEAEIQSLSDRIAMERKEHDRQFVLKAQVERARTENENHKEISKHKKEQRDREADEEGEKRAFSEESLPRRMIDAMSSGDSAQFARLLVTQTYLKEKMEGVSKLLNENPEMINFIYPGSYKHWEARAFREKVFKLLEKDSSYRFNPQDLLSLNADVEQPKLPNIEKPIDHMMSKFAASLPPEVTSEVEKLKEQEIANSNKDINDKEQ